MINRAGVLKAGREDLVSVLAWLKREYDEDGGVGFYCNRRVIEAAFNDKSLWVIRRDGQAVAFQVGDYAADILSVSKEHRRCGLATSLLEASIERARAANVNVLSVQCAPETSLRFWKRMGFNQYRDPQQPEDLMVRRALPRTFSLPANLPTAEVVIGFYPEAAQYGSCHDTPPIIEHHVLGARDLDGTIMLERRVIGLCDDEPNRRDLTVKISVRGLELCFCKAKYPDAHDFGVRHNSLGGTFFIDCVKPNKDDG